MCGEIFAVQIDKWQYLTLVLKVFFFIEAKHVRVFTTVACHVMHLTAPKAETTDIIRS